MKTVRLPQVLIAIVTPVLMLVVNYLIPTGPIHDYLIGLIGMIGGTGLVATRQPSVMGGTTVPAPTIAPGTSTVVPSTVPAKAVLDK